MTDNIEGELPAPRQSAAVAVINTHTDSAPQGSIYIAGGCDWFLDICYDDIFKISLSDSWSTQLDTLIDPREGATLTPFGDTLISFGGCDALEGICYNDIEVYRTLSEDD